MVNAARTTLWQSNEPSHLNMRNFKKPFSSIENGERIVLLQHGKHKFPSETNDRILNNYTSTLLRWKKLL